MPSPKTRLQHAVAEGDVQLLRDQLAAGADTEARDRRGLTALLVAAIHNRRDMARMLLEAGADPNAQDRQGRSALHFSVELPFADPDWVQLLLDAGADPLLADSEGQTPCDAISDRGHITCTVGELIAHDRARAILLAAAEQRRGRPSP